MGKKISRTYCSIEMLINSPALSVISNHSMAIAILNKSEEFVKNTTAASNYIPRRPRISIN